MQYENVPMDPGMKEVQTDLMNNISLQLWLVKLLQDGRVYEDQFTKMHRKYEDQIEQLMNQRKVMLEDTQNLDLKTALNEVKIYYEELKKKRELEIISEEEYKIKAKSFEWEINYLNKEIFKQESKIEFLKDPPHGKFPEEVINMKDKAETYRKTIERLTISGEISPKAIAIAKGSLDKILNYFDEFDLINHKPEVRTPKVRHIQEVNLDWYKPEFKIITKKKPEIHKLKIEEKKDEIQDINIGVKEIKNEIQDIIIKVKEENIEKPKNVRVICPYDDKKGDKCKVIAFGKTEVDAYNKLENHIKKYHPEKLTDIKETYAHA